MGARILIPITAQDVIWPIEIFLLLNYEAFKQVGPILYTVV